jgi:hypothetical protein
MKRTYQVEYRATYWVRAESEDEAIELGIEKHNEFPDGDYEAFIDPHVSPLEDLDDGTYIMGVNGLEDIERPMGGYWVGTVPVQDLASVPLGAYLGVWTDPSTARHWDKTTGQRYYDITQYEADLTKALKLGKQFSQISIWDIREARAIPVNI